MPNHKSCAKRVKTSEAERLRNRSFRTRLRQALKDLRAATSRDEAAVMLKSTTSLIDKAAGYGLIHKRTADRNKSRLARHVAKLG